MELFHSGDYTTLHLHHPQPPQPPQLHRKPPSPSQSPESFKSNLKFYQLAATNAAGHLQYHHHVNNVNQNSYYGRLSPPHAEYGDHDVDNNNKIVLATSHYLNGQNCDTGQGTVSYGWHQNDPTAKLREYESLEQSALNLSSQNRQHDHGINLLRRALASFIPQSVAEWTRYLSMKHSLGSIYVAKGEHISAARTFATVVLESLGVSSIDLSAVSIDFLGVGNQRDICPQNHGIPGLVSSLLKLYADDGCLISPERAAQTKRLLFKDTMGELPLIHQLYQYHLRSVGKNSLQGETPPVMDLVVANALLNLAKLLQDGINSGSSNKIIYLNGFAPTTVKILSLYILSYSLNRSPSTVNNIGILLASLLTGTSFSRPGPDSHQFPRNIDNNQIKKLALQYYHDGLLLDPKHPHLYTNLGSLLRQEGHVNEAIDAYHQAIKSDPHFSIALANLASCLKDQGNIDQAALYYHRAVEENVNFSEAVSGLANCFGTICYWTGRGGHGWETISVDRDDQLLRGKTDGWVTKIVQFAEDQLKDAQNWGHGVIKFVPMFENGALFKEISTPNVDWDSVSESVDEGAKVMSMIERNMREKQRQWYFDRLNGTESSDSSRYVRPKVPAMLATPLATTILPFHAFTLPFDATQVRLISEKCATRISVSSLTQHWVPKTVYPPPKPPKDGVLNVGYISSDFTNHPLAHLMQSVFGFHDSNKVRAFCYATSASDDSEYRKKIERESYKFADVHDKSTESIVNEIQSDGIHVLVNLNGFTKGARNEIFSVRPCPVQISLMGFAGPMGADWCDYILGDKIATPISTTVKNSPDYVYEKEKIIYMPDTLFCCDHRQSGPYSQNPHSWEQELDLRLQLRHELFPELPEDAFLLANFNQLYKIDPSTFAVWLKILCSLPNAYLWLLQFPKSGQYNLQKSALKWSGRQDVVNRIIFTPVAPKDAHIIRCRVCDLCLDTPECNAHTTAVDVMWSATPILTYPRHKYKLCSRIAASIVNAGFPKTEQGRNMVSRLIVSSDNEYGQRAIEFGSQKGREELLEMRRTLFEHRFESDLFNTRRFVGNLEKAYHEAWNQWLNKKHEPIFIDTTPQSPG